MNQYRGECVTTIVVYKSISGFTRTYAHWIAEALQTDCVELKKLDAGQLRDHPLVVFGGSLHAIGINGYERVKKLLGDRIAQDLIVFAVGASPARPGIVEEVRRNNFKTELEQNIPLFYLRGGFNYEKLDWPNKILMALLKFKIHTQKQRTADEQGMLIAYSKPLDATRRENIEPLLACVRQRREE